MEKIQTAINLHQSNNLLEAEKLYRELLNDTPTNEVILYHFAVLKMQINDLSYAEILIQKILKLNSKHKEANLLYARILFNNKKFEEAEKYSKLSFNYGIKNEKSLFWIGYSQEMLGKFNDAKNNYKKALQIKDENNIKARLNQLLEFDDYIRIIKINKEDERNYKQVYLAAAEFALKRKWKDALEEYTKAILLKKHSQFYAERAIVRLELNDTKGSEQDISEALKLDKKNSSVWTNYGYILKNTNNNKCIYAFKKALEINKNLFEANLNLAGYLLYIGKIKESEIYINRAIKTNPYSAQALNNKAVFELKNGRFQEAIEISKKSINLNKEIIESHQTYADALVWSGKIEEGINYLEKIKEIIIPNSTLYASLANYYIQKKDKSNTYLNYTLAIELEEEGVNKETITLAAALFFVENGIVSNAQKLLNQYENTNNTTALNALALLYANIGNESKSIEYFEKSLSIKSDQWVARSLYLFSLTYGGWYSTARIYEEAVKFNRINVEEAGIKQKTKFKNIKNTNRKLNIGYISGDFHNHAVSYFIKEILRSHDKEKFKIIAYYTSSKNDETTKEIIELVDNFNFYAKLSDVEIHENILQDNIDVLIDLSGHTSDHRLKVLAMKSAPIQCHYLGYMGTTGITAIDYWITDNVLHPEDTEEKFVEKLWRLNRVWVAYKNSNDLPNIISNETERFVYGSFNNIKKLNNKIFDLWINLLNTDKESILYLKNRDLSDEIQINRIKEYFKNRNIGSDRLVLDSGQNSHYDHMMKYNSVDCCLDTFPFNGGTTTADSLSMGVPVITLPGNSMGSRMSTSMLTSIKCDEWISLNESEYINKAKEYSRKARNIEYKNSIRFKFQNSDLANPKKLTYELEKTYIKMFESWIDKDN